MDFKDDESTEDDSEYNRLDEAEEEGWWREDDSEDEDEDESEDESEDLDCEQDIEEHEYTISGDATRTLKIRLFLTLGVVGEPPRLADNCPTSAPKNRRRAVAALKKKKKKNIIRVMDSCQPIAEVPYQGGVYVPCMRTPRPIWLWRRIA